MRRKNWARAILIGLWIAPLAAWAKDGSGPANLLNPTIGLNALFLAQGSPDLAKPYGLDFQEADLSLSAVVDPQWHLFSNIVFESDGVNVEELFAVSTFLPEVQFKVGKLYAAFGKHATLRAYAYPFVQEPLAVASTLGPDGFKSPGLEASWTPSLPWTLQFTLGAYHALEADDKEGPLDFRNQTHENIPWLGRMMNMVDLSEDATLEWGATFLDGMGGDSRHHSVLGTDLTLKNLPPKESGAAWILQGEYLQSGSWDNGGLYQTASAGWYASFQYRLLSDWWLGARAEEAFHGPSDILGAHPSGDPILGHLQKASANIAWTPSPNSFIRLEYGILQADNGNGQKPLDHRLFLQFDYNIGSNQAPPQS